MPVDDGPVEEPAAASAPPPGAAPTDPAPAPVVARRVRWTEHGPVPIEDEPPVADVEQPAPDLPDPQDVAPTVGAGDPSVTAKSSRRAARAAARAQRRADAAAAASPAITPPDEPTAASAEPVNDADAVRARLAARGVLRTSPSVRIRDVTESAPRVEPEPSPAVPISGEEEPSPVDALLSDAEALEPDPGGPSIEVSCLSCRSRQDVSVAATGYRCRTCTRVWRWATCDACGQLEVTLARQESWRCRECGATTRSWWRTPGARRHAETITDRRQVEAAEERRARALAALRRQRTRLVVGVVVAALLIAFVVVAGRVGRSADDTLDATSAATCAAFDDLAADLAANSVPPAALRARLDELAVSAADADEGLRIAAERLAASGRPGDPTFDDARNDLARRCRSSASAN